MRHRRVNPISQASSCMVVAFVMWSTVGPYVGPHQRFSDASQTLLAISGYPDSVTRGGGANSVEAAWHRVMARVFFLLWPLFRAPRHWFLESFLLSAPGVQSVFFLLRSVGAATFRRGQSKKKHYPECFFLLRPRGKAGEGEAPCRHGARAKIKTPPRFFFFAAAPPGLFRQ